LKWFVREEDVQQSSPGSAPRRRSYHRQPISSGNATAHLLYRRASQYELLEIQLLLSDRLLCVDSAARSTVNGSWGELIKSIVIDSEHFVIRFLLAAGIIFVLIKTMIRLLSLRGRDCFYRAGVESGTGSFGLPGCSIPP
jgi:hypothetical protein